MLLPEFYRDPRRTSRSGRLQPEKLMAQSGISGVLVALALVAWPVGAQPAGNEHGGRAVEDSEGEHAGRRMDGAGGMSMRRHRYVMRNGIPEAYRSRDNPLEPTQRNLEVGGRVYETNCASCHGTAGQGDGPAGKNLDPRPTDIARFSRMPMASDGYLYWTVTEGGAPVGSAMPAFGNVLSEEEIWQLLMYLRRM